MEIKDPALLAGYAHLRGRVANSFDERQIGVLWNLASQRGMSRREFLALLVAGGVALVLAACGPTSPTPESAPVVPVPAYELIRPDAEPLPPQPTPMPLNAFKPASYARLPRWRGFNLLEKFTLAGNRPYSEWDFDTIAEWGFDFVRLPTDYRIWTQSPGVYREQPLREIDQAIAWARSRGIHVSLNLHRAPGYCVNPPKESLNLWADDASGEQARQQFAAQWRMLTERYRGIPPAELSFNLVNEPGDITGAQYLRAATPAVVAIRERDPARLIVADGAYWGRRPVQELRPLMVAQSTRGYDPMVLTHYQASWVDGSDNWPLPTWPVGASFNQYLYGNYKPDVKSPLVLKTNLPQAAQLGFIVERVSAIAELLIWADGQLVFQKTFQPGAGAGEWKQSTLRPEWNSYEAVYDKEYTANLPAGTREIQIEVSKGDWLTFSGIRIYPFPGVPSQELVLKPDNPQMGVRQEPLVLDAQGKLSPVGGPYTITRQTLWDNIVQPWRGLAALGVGVHVGEWGAHSSTPHNVVLAWMKDCLQNWKDAGMGWALWNLRGDFGVLDSRRLDVRYEDYKGHRLDRKMLELLLQG